MWYLRFDVDRSQDRLRFSLSKNVSNILKDTDLEFVPYTGVVPLEPANCDISPHGLVFSGRTKEESTYTNRQAWTSDLFWIPISQLELQDGQGFILPRKISVERLSGSFPFQQFRLAETMPS